MIHPRIRAGMVARVAALAIGAFLFGAAPAAAGQYTMTFNAYANTQPGCSVWTLTGSTTFGYNPPCSTTPLGFYGGGNGTSMPAGARIGMQTNAPAGVVITSAFVSPYQIYNLNNKQGWGGGSYYGGGGSGWHDTDPYETDPSFASSYWGFQMICGWASCPNFGGIYLNTIVLTATENQGPALTAPGGDSLWYQGGHWIWNPPGDPWSAAISGSDPSGVCQMWVVLNSAQINSPGQTPDTAVWHQCPDWTWSAAVDTRNYVPGSGPLSLTLGGRNTAGVVSAPAETLRVDNQPVQLALSGPALASTTSGTQYIAATAGAASSGVAIGCSVDGAPEQWQNGSTRNVPVAGAGEHVVSCQAHNGAVDPQGQYAYSPVRTWSLNIGQPTVSAIGFQKLVNALKCRSVRKRVSVPARVEMIRRHGKLAKIRRPAHTKTVRVQRCHARIVWQKRTVWVKVPRHGRLVTVKRAKRVRVVLTPGVVTDVKSTVAYGHETTVSGWLGTAGGGVALGGAPVEILTAPDNGSGQFTVAATATTAANGGWTATLPAGPSRLVEAAYGGGPGLLPATSAAANLNVPARIVMSASPRRLPWPRTVVLRGHLAGGYVPPDGVALRLMIKLPGRKYPYEPVPFRTDALGRFSIGWSWGTGRGVATYPFAVATTATETDYAYAASQSRWVRVTFGVPTPPPQHHRRGSGHHRRR